MKIFNLNVNDFGGADKHLEEYKQKWCIKNGIILIKQLK